MFLYGLKSTTSFYPSHYVFHFMHPLPHPLSRLYSSSQFRNLPRFYLHDMACHIDQSPIIFYQSTSIRSSGHKFQFLHSDTYMAQHQEISFHLMIEPFIWQSRMFTTLSTLLVYDTSAWWPFIGELISKHARECNHTRRYCHCL